MAKARKGLSLPVVGRTTHFFCNCYSVLRSEPPRGVHIHNSLARTMLQQEGDISSQVSNSLPNQRRAGFGDREQRGLKIWKDRSFVRQGRGTWADHPLGPLLWFLTLPLGVFSRRKQGPGTCEVTARPVLWLQEHAGRFLLPSCLTACSTLPPHFPPGAGGQSGVTCVPGGSCTYISSAECSVWP